MRKLLSLLAVAAIVTSAFAFTTKVATFCVLNAAGNACQVLQGRQIVTGQPNFAHFPLGAGGWNGNAAACTGANPATDCDVPINLVID